MSKPSTYPSPYADTLYWAGIALALGAFGVVITSIFYALSPVPAALPIPNPVIADALEGMVTGRTTMIIAGNVGILSDIILTAGTFLLMIFRPPASAQIERIGWGLVTISVLIFIFVDSLSAGVLTQIAAMNDAETMFAGFKLLFDILFVAGTLALGLGAPLIFISEIQSPTSVLARPLSWVGLLSGVAGLVSGLLYFANISLPLVLGLSIGIGSFIFAIYGIQIARSQKRLKSESYLVQANPGATP